MKRIELSVMTAAVMIFLSAATCSAGGFKCPGGMVLVREKTCMDAYEYPDIKGVKPLTGVAWEEASRLCSGNGKRLCSFKEWQAACEGPKGYDYPYGNVYDPEACNGRTEMEDEAVKSGSREKCVSGYGVYDLPGNVWEWVSDSYSNGAYKGLQGGSAKTIGAEKFRCSQPLVEDPSVNYGLTGFRCCEDAVITESDSVETAPPLVVEETPHPAPKPDLFPNGMMTIANIPYSSAREGFYLGGEMADFGDILKAPAPNDVTVSASLRSLTAGLKVDSFRVDYTDIKHNITTSYANRYEKQTRNSGIIHAAYTFDENMVYGGWTGQVTVGGRRFNSGAGSTVEGYALRDFTKDNTTVTVGVNVLNNASTESKPGGLVDFRYRVSRNAQLFTMYHNVDFYKTILNEYIAPVTSIWPLMTCDGCRKSSASAGVALNFQGGRGIMHFMIYDIGDLNMPTGGFLLNFR